MLAYPGTTLIAMHAIKISVILLALHTNKSESTLMKII